MLHLWPVIEDWQGMRIFFTIYTIFWGDQLAYNQFLADQAVYLGINWKKKPVDPLKTSRSFENHLIPLKNRINSHVFWISSQSGLTSQRCSTLHCAVGIICQKWLPKMAAKVLFLGHLAPNPLLSSPDLAINDSKWRKMSILGSQSSLVQSRSSTQNGGKTYFFSCPLQSRPLASSDQAGRYSIIKMVEKYYLFLVQFNPDPGPIQIKLAGTQNGGKTMFHLPPQWQQV